MTPKLEIAEREESESSIVIFLELRIFLYARSFNFKLFVNNFLKL